MPSAFPFAVLVCVTVAAAFMVVTSRNIIHAAVFLGISFVGVAGLYLLLQAPFIAGAQVLIYVGAITVLILFALMLTGQRIMREPRGAIAWKLPCAALALVLFAILVKAIYIGAPWKEDLVSDIGTPGKGGYETITPLAISLLGTYLLPFEVASVLLLVALVGAIVLAKEERSL
jgi:NADH:ubiquinone oxidoreductase subunit 6 (subunit J)